MYKNFNLKAVHTPRNTICNHVLPKRRDTGAFDKNSFHRLKFQDCQLKHMSRQHLKPDTTSMLKERKQRATARNIHNIFLIWNMHMAVLIPSKYYKNPRQTY